MIVVDTNAVAYALIQETHTEVARRVREMDPLRAIGAHEPWANLSH